MQPLWTSGDVLLKQLVDILESTVEDTEESEGEDDSNVDKTDPVTVTLKRYWLILAQYNRHRQSHLIGCLSWLLQQAD